MTEPTKLSTVETDVEKAKRYKQEIVDAVGPLLEIMNAAKKDGLKLAFNLGENNITWFVADITIVRPL